MREFKREWEVWRAGGNPTGHALFQCLSIGRLGGMHGLIPRGLAMVWETRLLPCSALTTIRIRIDESHQHRAHMQHLTWGISSGLVGIILWVGFVNVVASLQAQQLGDSLGRFRARFELRFRRHIGDSGGVVIFFLALFASSPSALTFLNSTRRLNAPRHAPCRLTNPNLHQAA